MRRALQLTITFVLLCTTTQLLADQSTIVGDVAKKNVVQVAVGSKDHSTLVTAVKAASLVDSLSNPGPFTVFAPTNAAFDKLPKGTVENLLKPENLAALQDILEYHVFVGVLRPNMLVDGADLGEANGDHVKVSVKNGKVFINDAAVLASVPAANGIVHVIDTVLLPPKKTS